MNNKFAFLRPSGSLLVDTKLPVMTKNKTQLTPPKITEPFEAYGFRNFGEDEATMKRQASILSFQNLSIDDCGSVCDSQYSHFNPSINEPFVSEDATHEEKSIHAFLDAAGIFQVNVKQ